MNYHKKIEKVIKDQKVAKNQSSQQILPSWVKNFMIGAGLATSLIACPNQDNNQTTPSEPATSPPSRGDQDGEVQPEEPVTPRIPERKTPKDPQSTPKDSGVRPLYGVPSP